MSNRMITPLVQRCCLCGEVRQIADIDSKVVHSRKVILHYCGDCLGQEKTEEAPTGKHSIGKRLSAREIKAMGQTPISIVLETATIGFATKAEINGAISAKWGGFLRYETLERTLDSLVTRRLMTEGRRGCRKVYRLTTPAPQKAGGAA